MRCGFVWLLLAASPAAAGDQARLGLFNLKVVGLNPALAEAGIDALASAIGKMNAGEVVTASELNALLEAEKRNDALGCDDVTCLVEIGIAAGIERLVAGSLTKAGDKLVVSLQLIDVQHAKVKERVTLEWRGAESGFASLLAAAAELLLVSPTARAPGKIALAGAPPGAEWRIGQQPIQGPTSADLDTGVYSVRVEAMGYTTLETQAVVRAGQTTTVAAALRPSGAGAVVGLGVALGAFKPTNGDLATRRSGLALDAVYWHELGALAIEPRFGMRWDVRPDEEADYLEVVGDVGVHWLVLHRPTTPFVGAGGGARWLRRKHQETFVFGNVVRTTARRVVEEDGYGVGGYGRAGVLFFRDASVRGSVSLDYELAYFGEDDRPQGLRVALGFVF
ncbi:MAG: PEGA domain-containing protein [Deltaproteobacteria bacterium]|nr:PEGA domain-containing protein [Deltaproteobacteria bacterium]